MRRVRHEEAVVERGWKARQSCFLRWRKLDKILIWMDVCYESGSSPRGEKRGVCF